MEINKSSLTPEERPDSGEYEFLLDHIGISVYVIDKESYELLYINGTALRASGNRSYSNKRCFRYFNGLDEPCPWCSLPIMKDGYGHVDENYVPSLDHWYRHDVRDIKWHGHDAAAFYITNITDQKRRQMLDEERMANLYQQTASANPNALAMFRLNLTKNTCYDARSKYETALRQQNAGTVDGYLAACAEIITDDMIRQDCLTRFTLPNLLREFQNGVSEMSIEYPIRSSEGETIWIDGAVIMARNSVSGDIEGIAYAVNVTDQKIRNSILERMSEEKYDHIGLINTNSRRYELWKKDSVYELDSRQWVDFDAIFQDILNLYVCPEDREVFIDHGKLENIIARLEKDGEDSFVFRCRAENGGYQYKQARYIWLDERRELIMESQTDLTSLYEHQIEQVKRQREAELAKERAFSAESIPAGIGVLDYEKGSIRLNYLNNGFYQMIGASREAYREYEEMGIINAVFPEDRPALSGEMEMSIREKRQSRCRIRLLDGTGSYRWIELVANHAALNDAVERFYVAFYDIDALIRSRMELREKELVFQDILSYSDIIHFTYYPEKRRCEAEIVPLRFGGIPKALDGYPDSFIRFTELSEADAKAYRAMVRAIDDGAPEAECVTRMSYRGKSGWYRVHLTRVTDASGNTIKAIGNMFNADSTVEAEKAIADERLRVESLRGVYLATASFNVTKDTEIIFNTGGSLSRSVEMGAKALEEARKIEPCIDNQRPETLSSLLSAAEQIFDEERRHEFIRCFSHEGMERLFREGKRDITLEYRRKMDGGLMWVSTRVILMAEPSTGDIFAFFYTRDISEQKKSEQITKLTLEKNCDYIALLNVMKRTMNYRSISKEEEKFGEKAEPAEPVSVEELIEKLEKSGEFSLTYDREAPDGAVQRKQIQYRWLDDSKAEILVVQTDITAAYVQEQERTRQLQEALAAAEKANNAKTEFISRISHDIRTPISAITNMTAFAREDADDREKLLRDLERIEASNTLLLSLINDVLDISKIDSGKIELRPEPYPYDEYIECIRDIFEPLCQQKGLSFIVQGGESAQGHGVLVDRVRYNQISLNLLSNAVKYTPAGGTITYASRARKRADGMIECGFDISDTGIGMSERFQKTMFDPFTQDYSNPDRRKLSSGTGLGLSIVKKLVDLMGGSIKVTSELGKGTTVSVDFVLPEASAKSPEALIRKEGEDESSVVLSGKTLLAEDNEINTEIAIRILNSLGVQVDHAENGRRAVEMFSASEPGEYFAVMMDIQMPVMNGYEATRAIRALPRPDAKTIPIIAMTADAFEESVKASREAGMNDYITKPFEPRELLSVLRNNR